MKLSGGTPAVVSMSCVLRMPAELASTVWRPATAVSAVQINAVGFSA